MRKGRGMRYVIKVHVTEGGGNSGNRLREMETEGGMTNQGGESWKEKQHSTLAN